MTNNPYPIPKRYLEPAALAARSKLSRRLTSWAQAWKGDSGAVLVGATGCGKSLAASWAADIERQRRSDTWVKWIRADELSRILSERGGGERIELVKMARVLVIDELGYERFPELILEVLGSRHDNSRPTIVTSGLTVSAIAERYSDATVRRVIEIGNGDVINSWDTKKAPK